MSAKHASQSAGSTNTAAFAFVQSLAGELSGGKVDLPSFPDIAMRVRQTLADDNVTPAKIVRVVSSEPALAARLLQIANSAALNIAGKAVNDLRTAVARMGFNMVRSAAIAFAMSQLKKVDELKGLEKPLDDLWRRSCAVAAMSHVLARRFSKVNPDTALLAGLLHGVGQLYILTRASKHPELFANQPVYHAIVRDWHANIAKALLENWDMAEEIVLAVSEYEQLERDHKGPVDLTDVLSVAHLLVAYQDHPESIELNMQGVRACARMQLDANAYQKIIAESAAEITAMQQALGHG
ncbi:MAG TPA: HDOD domain-containing protein [Steroidobacteraceae bacterium]|jgi:HD-like signal output (HDOD) protein|nr:HDOD domain-containing protein [Steroidobacteraceae bacterium]